MFPNTMMPSQPDLPQDQPTGYPPTRPSHMAAAFTHL
jgi:hypothetical protein